jgi:hypothetical protein
MDTTSMIYWVLRHFGLHLALAAMVALSSVTPAAAAGVGAAFLRNNMDVRSEAMGGGAGALTEGAAAAFKNPAGAAGNASSELLFSYSEGLLGSSYQGVSYMRAPGRRNISEYKVSSTGIRERRRVEEGRTSIGVHAVYHQLGEFQTTDGNFQNTGSVRPYNLAAGVTVARPIGAVSAGLTLKAIHQSLGTHAANSYAADAGIIAPTGLRGLSLSASVTNVGTRARFDSESTSLPSAANLGLGLETRFVRVAADYRSPLGGGERGRFALGAEFTPFGSLALRAGYLNNLGGLDAQASGASTGGLGFGAGFFLGRYSLDYAVVPTAFESTNKISLRMKF